MLLGSVSRYAAVRTWRDKYPAVLEWRVPTGTVLAPGADG